MKLKESFFEKSNGITLIALVVTIVVLIILAVISINVVLGEDGILKQAERARDFQANAEASDREALSELNKYLANTIGENSSTGETNPETLEIKYKIEDIDQSAKAVILSYTGANASYEEYAEEILEGKGELEIAQIFVEGQNYNNELYEWGDPTYTDIYDLIEDWDGEGVTIEEFYKGGGYNSLAEMAILYGNVKPEGYQGATVGSTAKNGTHEISGIKNEFIATRNGTYAVKAIAKDGREAEIQVSVTGIVEEKFSEIYDETTTITEGERTAKIPAGFAVGISDGINTIEEGLVITDAVDSEGYSIGNEFVWIPVDSEADLTRTYFDDNGQPTAGLPSYCTEPYASGYSDGSGTEENAEYRTMKTQVVGHYGFYIGRYESGVNTATIRTNPTETQTVVVKRGVAPYNDVPWGASMSDINSDITVDSYDQNGNETELQTKGAVYLSQNMYTNSESVTSTLIYGCQWDAMCRYIGDNNREAILTNNVKVTGRIGGDVSKNIYDLAGNCFEWTMEAGAKNARSLRGSDCYNPGAISFRLTNFPENTSYYNECFRVALYINEEVPPPPLPEPQ